MPNWTNALLSPLLNRIRRREVETRREIANLRAAVELAKLCPIYFPWPKSFMTPGALKLVVDDILINQRKIVVELGSGISTVYLGVAARMIGGRVISFEQSDAWQTVVTGWLKTAGVQDHATIVHAPLKAITARDYRGDWYDMDVVRDVLKNIGISQLLVDGPTACSEGRGLARYPALVTLHEWLEQDCSVFLDDIDRPGEKEILDRWEHDTGFRFNRLSSVGPIGYATRGKAFFIGA